MKNRFRLFALVFVLAPLIVHSAEKPRLVVMQVQGKGLSNDDRNSYRTAIVKGLGTKYEILSGNSVDTKAKEIFQKESSKAVECDTEKCFQDIAVAFQAELIAVTTIVKKNGGYILNLQINNVLENRNILSESKPCRGCDDFQVIDELIAMARSKVSVSATASPTASAPVVQRPLLTPQEALFLKRYEEKELQRKAKTNPDLDPTGMVTVKGGCFDMGDTFGDGKKWDKNALPVHRVCLDDFKLDKYEVTAKAFRKKYPEAFSDLSNRPASNVYFWFQANDYCESIGKRLPTEAEWEYAARSGGKNERYAGTNSWSELGDYAWVRHNSSSTSQIVGEKKPNGLGLYDMTGNVWEWVSDFYSDADLDFLGENYYANSPVNNPKGPPEKIPGDSLGDNSHVARGGSWASSSTDLLIFARSSFLDRVLSYGTREFGFRCAK